MCLTYWLNGQVSDASRLAGSALGGILGAEPALVVADEGLGALS
jgi:hypothetical protein